jgi:hypothetical protein
MAVNIPGSPQRERGGPFFFCSGCAQREGLKTICAKPIRVEPREIPRGLAVISGGLEE